MVSGDLRDFIRRHRVYYEVLPEFDVGARGRTMVGYEIRLFAVHQKAARALPGCAKCGPLVDALRALAGTILPVDERPTLATVQRFDPVLYDSKEVPGADEVSVAIRLCHRDHYERPVDACEIRCLKEVRERLKVLGVPER